MPRPADLLSKHAPDPNADPGDLQELWQSIDRPDRSRFRQPVGIAVGLGSVAAATALVLVVPGLVRPQPTVPEPVTETAAVTTAEPAPSFDQLVAAAAARPGPTLADGQYLHIRTKFFNDGSHRADGKEVAETNDTYFNYNGDAWIFEADDPDPKPFWHHVVREETDLVASAAFLATLPTDPDELLNVIRPVAYRADEVYWGEPPKTKEQKKNVTVQYMMLALGYGCGPSEVNAAMIKAIQQIDEWNVTKTKTTTGEPCIKLERANVRPRDYICFDPKTSEALETGADHWRRTVLVSEVIDELPPGPAEATQTR